jgi:xanthine/uracil/vitamin C permease (AzgA family)
MVSGRNFRKDPPWQESFIFYFVMASFPTYVSVLQIRSGRRSSPRNLEFSCLIGSFSHKSIAGTFIYTILFSNCRSIVFRSHLFPTQGWPLVLCNHLLLLGSKCFVAEETAPPAIQSKNLEEHQ